MPGRQFSASSYRYGFNGKENDPETSTQDYGMRIYNPGLGRFLSTDPLTRQYSYKSSYDFAENDVIRNVDLDGEEKLNKVFSEQKYNIQEGKITKNATPILKISNPTEYDQNLAKVVVEANRLPTTGFGNMHYGGEGEYLDYFVEGERYQLNVSDAVAKNSKAQNLNNIMHETYKELQGIVNMFMVDFTLNRLGYILGSGKSSGVSETKFGGQVIIIDENIYSKTLMTKLIEEEYEVMLVTKKTTDAKIIARAKEMDAIVLTNNVKDFANKGIKILGASDNMKKQPQRVIDLIKKAEQNIKAGKADLKAPRGVSLANQEKL